jgi:hypothetical protein
VISLRLGDGTSASDDTAAAPPDPIPPDQEPAA